MGVTFHAEIEAVTVKSEVEPVVEIQTPPKPVPPPASPNRTPETKPRAVEPPTLARQCAFARPCAQADLDTEWLEMFIYAGCIASVIFAGYSLGYRHALENTLSNMLADLA